MFLLFSVTLTLPGGPVTLKTPLLYTLMTRNSASGRKLGARGQALIEYLLMMVMLLFVFTGLYRVLTGEVKNKMFKPAGKAILRTYWKQSY